jgi:hypothetical protein
MVAGSCPLTYNMQKATSWSLSSFRRYRQVVRHVNQEVAWGRGEVGPKVHPMQPWGRGPA